MSGTSPDALHEAAGRTLCTALREAGRRWGDRPAMLTEGQSWTWAELDADVDRLAGMLSRIGVQPGETVGFLLTNRPEVVIGFLA